MGTSKCLDSHILQNILFKVQQKKENYNFWVNYPLKFK